jgi:hypothetical protein
LRLLEESVEVSVGSRIATGLKPGKRDPMSNGITLHTIRRFLVVGFGGGAVLIALLVASSISGISGSVTPNRIAEGHRLVVEWNRPGSDRAAFNELGR